ncbi:phage tail terminator-like protein [Pusillimonas noertemannii]|uniref:Uncharacterized protein DUF4128 n=1 Tax=Pusillimonas noertemannii TaxID=305977 RepID=A0A2U1CRW6_9BURK|nr:phage tail terminator-like protein [Pusillimonas noertemannii]NYT67976.1 hypothetical protein [Pusillimonas noertemannii]PVY68650.1 uncharacterized protein DUF4128 [Pusillimonas noertemannii]TFL11883.1 hypothetical protein CSC72_01770 [Pusillimonas noertemannii]
MTFDQIRIAITTRMTTFAGIEQARIEYPNQPGIFTPPDTGLWCRLSILPGTSFMAGMADQPYTRKPGLIVVQCFARARTGVKALAVLADALEAHFAYWTFGDLECLEASQVNVGAGDTAGRPEGTGFYQINVSIPYRAG